MSVANDALLGNNSVLQVESSAVECEMLCSAHIFLFRLVAGKAAEEAPWVENFRTRHHIAMRVLQELPRAPPGADTQLIAPNLCRLAIESRQTANNPSAASDKSVDVQQPCVSELERLVHPVRDLQVRLAQLLEEWPENPLLEQLVAICNRLLGGLAVHLWLFSLLLLVQQKKVSGCSSS